MYLRKFHLGALFSELEKLIIHIIKSQHDGKKVSVTAYKENEDTHHSIYSGVEA